MSFFRKLEAVSLVLANVSVAHAGLITGFEQGLDGWEYIGDVSIQTADIGTEPSQAKKMAVITTMCDPHNPPSQTGYCDVSEDFREYPYSGVSSPSYKVTWDFLSIDDYPRELYNAAGDSGALKTQFFAPRAGVFKFDWNYIGEPFDEAYFHLFSEEAGSLLLESLYNGLEGIDWLDRIPTNVELCARQYYDPADIDYICDLLDYPFYGETGWKTKSVEVFEPGWYWFGFGMGEIAEGNGPSALALDNIRYRVVAEPGTLLLLGIGLVGTGLARRRRKA